MFFVVLVKVCFCRLGFQKIEKIKLDNNNDLSLNIKQSIIPAIHHLQKRLPEESLTTVLGSDLVMARLSSLQLDPSFLCVDLRQSDIFFDSFKKKLVLFIIHFIYFDALCC